MSPAIAFVSHREVQERTDSKTTVAPTVLGEDAPIAPDIIHLTDALIASQTPVLG